MGDVVNELNPGPGLGPSADGEQACAACGTGHDVERHSIGHRGRTRGVLLCCSCSAYLALAQDRAEVTGETVERAISVLSGGGWHRPEDTEQSLAEVLAEIGVSTVARACAECGLYAEHGLIVRLIATANGPGGEVVACLPCARTVAARQDAPQWLSDDLGRIDTAAAWVRAALIPQPARSTA